jgi:hypothetical protein
MIHTSTNNEHFVQNLAHLFISKGDRHCIYCRSRQWMVDEPPTPENFRCTAKAIYRITDEGVRTAHWDIARAGTMKDSPSSSMANLSTVEHPSFDKDIASSNPLASSDAKIHRRISLAKKHNAGYTAEGPTERRIKESNTER